MEKSADRYGPLQTMRLKSELRDLIGAATYEGTYGDEALRFRSFLRGSIGHVEWVKSLRGFGRRLFPSRVTAILLEF